ncbi:MAG: hypothetical protein U5L45_24455 [Saprospiraceae bacterium]|nr:hypothetical protein [Saprospiraceae bacterium]
MPIGRATIAKGVGHFSAKPKSHLHPPARAKRARGKHLQKC